ncbi:MAG: hypothetical protein ACYC5M_16240 [Anaerolineae bacterium]
MQTQLGGTMKRVYLTVVYFVLTTAALVMASGAPASWGGTGGGG